MQILAVALLLFSLAVGWFGQLLGLPGNWLIVAAAALYAWLTPGDTRASLSWQVVLALVVVAVLAEVVELASASLGVKRMGGSRRGAIGALAGSALGAFAGLFVGLPIPIIGSLVTAMLGACGGALVGTWLAERSVGRSHDDSWKIGQAAFIGRLWGTLAKVIACSVLCAVTIAALLV